MVGPRFRSMGNSMLMSNRLPGHSSPGSPIKCDKDCIVRSSMDSADTPSPFTRINDAALCTIDWKHRAGCEGASRQTASKIAVASRMSLAMIESWEGGSGAQLREDIGEARPQMPRSSVVCQYSPHRAVERVYPTVYNFSDVAEDQKRGSKCMRYPSRVNSVGETSASRKVFCK
jgi:hypothetical protein